MLTAGGKESTARVSPGKEGSRQKTKRQLQREGASKNSSKGEGEEYYGAKKKGGKGGGYLEDIQ